MGCKEFECFICGKCKEKAPTKASKSSSDPKVKAKAAQRITTQAQMADATIVYMLGTVDGVVQLDEHSGLNGYHIRTIPGTRWGHPTMVGAGAGYVAVVDSFQDYDLIRITDKYGGAGVAGFDSDGFPLGSIDWSKIMDICSVATPTGVRVTGLKISPQGYLIANISRPGSYLKFDIRGNSPFMQGVNTLPAPFDTLGTFFSTPAIVDANIGPHMFHVMSLMRCGDGSYAVVVLDTVLNQVTCLQGIPASPTPISISLSNYVASVLCGDNGIASQIVRFTVDFAGGGLAAGVQSDQKTPKPQSYNVDQYPELKDFSGQNFPADRLTAYYQTASVVNESNNAANRVIPGSFSNLPTPNASSDSLNDSRVSQPGYIVSSFYQNQLQVPCQIIQVPTDLALIAFESGYSTVTELFARKDTSQPSMRVLHGGHYDIVSEGGYVYG